MFIQKIYYNSNIPKKQYNIKETVKKIIAAFILLNLFPLLAALFYSTENDTTAFQGYIAGWMLNIGLLLIAIVFFGLIWAVNQFTK